MSTLESPSPDTTPGSEDELISPDLREMIDAYADARVTYATESNALLDAWRQTYEDKARAELHAAEKALRAALSRETTDTQRLDAPNCQQCREFAEVIFHAHTDISNGCEDDGYARLNAWVDRAHSVAFFPAAAVSPEGRES